MRYHFAKREFGPKMLDKTSRNRIRPVQMIRALALTALCVGLLNGCGTPPVKSETEQPGAQAAYSRGEYEQAAASYQQDAMQASAEDASRLWVSAADAWMLAGNTAQARDALSWVDRPSLSNADRARLDLVLADLALWSQRPDEAEILLQKAADQIPTSSRKRYDDLYARLIQQLNNPASEEIARAGRLSDGMKFYDPLASVEMMQILEGVSTGELAIRANNPRGERRLAGWLDLALVVRANLVDPTGISAAVTNWKSRHPYHLLNENQALDTWLRYRHAFAPPRRVAVILPGSGRLQGAGAGVAPLRRHEDPAVRRNLVGWQLGEAAEVQVDERCSVDLGIRR